MDAAAGIVRLVVLNYQGGDDLHRCVAHLTALEPPPGGLEVVVVDNASTDGSAEAVQRAFPEVRVLRQARNTGFPANNVALRDLRGVRAVGLVNNDAFVEPGYLGPLLAALDADPMVGAVCPLIVFDDRVVDLELTTPAERPGRGDPRALGVAVTGLRVTGVDRWSGARFASGSHGREQVGSVSLEWTGPTARLRVPVGAAAPPTAVELRLHALSARDVVCRSGSRVTQVAVGTAPAWVTVGLDGTPYEVVNNAGSVVYADGYGADRLFGVPTAEADLAPVDVFAWCGGAVLFRPAYLLDVGLFDESFFLYYEDTDLSWRGRTRGWRYRFVPEARVRHRHAASTGVGDARFAHFTERNRLAMVCKDGSPALVRRAVGSFMGETYDAARRDVVAALVQGRRPNPTPVRRRVGALAGLAPMLPGLWSARRAVADRATVPAAEVEASLLSR